jgi:subtilisin family serine protease
MPGGRGGMAGIVVVAAAGNDGRDDSLRTSGYGTINAPGNDPYVITVGAMKTMDTPSRSDDQIASYTSKGPTLIDHVVKPDLVAPGNRIVSLRSPDGTLDVGYPQNLISYSAYTRSANNRPSSFYFQLSGTSMSRAMVSGTAALLLEKREIDGICEMIRKAARAGIPALKYNLCMLGVVRTEPTRGRGGCQYSTFVYYKARRVFPFTEAGAVREDEY